MTPVLPLRGMILVSSQFNYFLESVITERPENLSRTHNTGVFKPSNRKGYTFESPFCYALIFRHIKFTIWKLQGVSVGNLKIPVVRLIRRLVSILPHKIVNSRCNPIYTRLVKLSLLTRMRNRNDFPNSKRDFAQFQVDYWKQRFVARRWTCFWPLSLRATD